VGNALERARSVCGFDALQLDQRDKMQVNLFAYIVGLSFSSWMTVSRHNDKKAPLKLLSEYHLALIEQTQGLYTLS